MKYWVMWVNRNGQQGWSGPYRSSVTAKSHLDQILDKSGGWLIIAGHVTFAQAAQPLHTWEDSE